MLKRQQGILCDMAEQHTWEHLNQRFSSLLASPLNGQTAPGLLEEWVSLNRAVYQTRGELIRTYYAYSTDDQAKAAHDAFVRDHYPRLAAASKDFIGRLIESGTDYPAEWRQFINATNLDQPSEELLALQGEEEQLGKSFQQIRASTIYHSEGQEVEPGELAAKLQHPDRDTRRAAYMGLIGSEHTKEDELNELFVKLHGIRTRIAQAAGYDTYYDYAVGKGVLKNKAYTPEDTRTFREGVKKYIVPLFLELRQGRKKSLELEDLQPWDTMLNPFGVTPMAEFSSDADALDRAERVLDKLDPEFGDVLRKLRADNLIDIESRASKARHGEAGWLPETEQPFLIMHIGPRAFNIQLLFHELGHAIHFAMMPKGQPYEVYDTPLEFAEFISQTFEVITTPLSEEFFKADELKIVNYLLLERICFEIMNMTKLDEFQEAVYKEKSLDAEKVNVIYDRIDADYPTGVEWGDVAYLRPYFWKNFTMFSSPFYRFEYAIAWVAALQFQETYQNKPGESLAKFKSAMRLGFTRSARELFEEAGINLRFGEETLAQTANDLRTRMVLVSVPDRLRFLLS
jgi:oligoendopeptidase F